MFNHSLKRWHSSVGLTILSTCKIIAIIINVWLELDAMRVGRPRVARRQVQHVTERCRALATITRAHTCSSLRVLPAPLLHYPCHASFFFLGDSSKFLVPCENFPNVDFEYKLEGSNYISSNIQLKVPQCYIGFPHSSRSVWDATPSRSVQSCCENLALALWELKN